MAPIAFPATPDIARHNPHSQACSATRLSLSDCRCQWRFRRAVASLYDSARRSATGRRGTTGPRGAAPRLATAPGMAPVAATFHTGYRLAASGRFAGGRFATRRSAAYRFAASPPTAAGAGLGRHHGSQHHEHGRDANNGKASHSKLPRKKIRFCRTTGFAVHPAMPLCSDEQ